MKKVEITIDEDYLKGVIETLDQGTLLYSYTKLKMNGETVNSISLLVPDVFLDELITKISEKIDLRNKTSTISIVEIEGYVSTHLDRLKEKALKDNPPPNPIERLIESTDKYTNINRNITLFVIFATIIALIGLFSDNITIIIGAMLLSPLLGPINSFAVNTNLGRTKFIVKSQQTSLLLLLTVIATAFILTTIALYFTPLTITTQIDLRGHPSIVDILLAFVLGCAAGLALITDFSELLVGVAVAVALLPPAAVTGIGLAMLNFQLSFEALLLSIINLIGLQLGSIIILNLTGFTPRRDYQKSAAKRYSRYFISAVLIILLVLVLILYLQ